MVPSPIGTVRGQSLTNRVSAWLSSERRYARSASSASPAASRLRAALSDSDVPYRAAAAARPAASAWQAESPASAHRSDRFTHAVALPGLSEVARSAAERAMAG